MRFSIICFSILLVTAITYYFMLLYYVVWNWAEKRALLRCRKKRSLVSSTTLTSSQNWTIKKIKRARCFGHNKYTKTEKTSTNQNNKNVCGNQTIVCMIAVNFVIFCHSVRYLCFFWNYLPIYWRTERDGERIIILNIK